MSRLSPCHHAALDSSLNGLNLLESRTLLLSLLVALHQLSLSLLAPLSPPLQLESLLPFHLARLAQTHTNKTMEKSDSWPRR